MTPERFARLKQALNSRQHDLTVLADGVHKEHNVSAIIRTCDAVAIARLHAVSPGRAFRRHHMIAGGSKRWVDVTRHKSTAEAFEILRTEGFRILAAQAGDGAVDYRETDYTQPVAIVLGAERQGPSRYAIAHADGAISIPMRGLVESLNVSVAAAVILYEAERQRREAGLYARRPPDEARFTTTLFEWAWPEIALRCRKQGIPYPALDEDGQLTRNPFESS